MVSSLEKKVAEKVQQVQSHKQAEAAREQKEAEAFKAKLPKTREERALIVFPSITDGKWEYYFAAGHWRLKFWVKEVAFEIHDYYVPYDSGTPTEGYGPTDAHWSQGLFGPDGHMLDSIGDVDDSWLTHLKDPDDNKSETEIGSKAWHLKELENLIQKLNDRIASAIERYFLRRR